MKTLKVSFVDYFQEERDGLAPDFDSADWDYNEDYENEYEDTYWSGNVF